MYWNVSYKANPNRQYVYLGQKDEPAVTLPPGELMYIEIGLSGLSASRKRSCATINALTWSLTCHQQFLKQEIYWAIKTYYSLFQ